MKGFRERLLSIIMIIMMVWSPFGVPMRVYAASQTAAGESGSSFQVDFINVGQGDASLVQCDGHYMLIDGGAAKKSSLIYSYLKARSISHIDVMVATHPDADHIGGLSGALNYATVGVAYCSVTEHDTKTFQSFVKYLGDQGKAITVPKAGDTFDLGSAKVTALGPTKTAAEANNNSIVLRVVYGDTSFLFTGDAEDEEEKDILNSKRTIASTVLKVGHHGSKYSTGYQFLREVSPAYAVISVGKDNSYGHPTEDTLSKLRDADVAVYRTDMQGHIICRSDGKTVTFTPEKNADADTLAGAGAGQNGVISSAASTASEQQNITIQLTPSADSAPVVDRSMPVSGVATATDTGTQGTEQAAQEPVPVGETYVLNTNTHKFHQPSCKSVGQMAEKNKEVYTGSRDDIISRGYQPCKNCNP